MTKRTYPAEFKQEAVRLYETTDKSIREIERELGITHGLLNKWKRKLKDEGQAAFPGRGHLLPEQEKIRQLERKLAIAEQERDILKKAVAIFSDPRKKKLTVGANYRASLIIYRFSLIICR